MPAIPYRFTSEGVSGVEHAFESIESRAVRSTRALKDLSRAQSDSAKAANTNARAARGVGGINSAQRKSDKETLYAQDQLRKSKENTAKLGISAAKAQAKAEQGAAKNREKLGAKWHRDEMARQRDLQRASREATRISAREAAAKEHVAMRHRQASLGSMVATGSRWVARGAAVVGGGAALVGGLALRQGLELQESAASLAVRSRAKGETAADPTQLRKEFQDAAASAPGVGASQIAGTVQTIVSRTGELGLARAWESEMATIISATGVEGQDLGNVMSTMMQKFGITTKSGMAQALADLTFQGKKGAFELADMAQYMGEVGASAERFGGLKGAEGVRTIGGMMQIARTSTGSGAEAATAVETMFRQLVSDSKGIKQKTGVDVFKDKNKTKTNDFMSLIPKIIAGAKGNQATLAGIFDVRGIRAISPLIATFNELRAAGSSEKAAMAGVTAMMQDAMRTGANWSDLQQDAALRQATPQAQLQAAWQATVSTITDAALPAITELGQALGKMAASEEFQAEVSILIENVVGVGTALVDLASWIDSLSGGGGDERRNEIMGQIAQRKAGREKASANAELKRLGVTPEMLGELQHGAKAETNPKVLAGEGKGTITQDMFDAFQKSRGAKRKLFSKDSSDLAKEKPAEPEVNWAARAIFGSFAAPALGAIAGVGDYFANTAAKEDKDKVVQQAVPSAIEAGKAAAALGLSVAADKLSAAADKLEQKPSIFGGLR